MINQPIPPTSNQKNTFAYDCLKFFATWTPRVVIGAFVGYYSLGVAYERGIMAAIDRIAIKILKPSLGYAGIGAIMPTVQWYAAWGVRVTATLAAEILYGLIERIVIALASLFYKQKAVPQSQPQTPALPQQA